MRRHESRATADKTLRQLFKERSSELNWLAFLLTGDREQSAQTFTRAFDLADASTPVFQEFMAAWARKLVIAAALATIHKELRESVLRTARSRGQDFANLDALPSRMWISDWCMTKPEFERAVLAIDVFPRCVLLLAVFERLSIQEVAELLNTDETLVRTAQGRGLIELTLNMALGRGWTPARATPNMGLNRCGFISPSSYSHQLSP